MAIQYADYAQTLLRSLVMTGSEDSANMLGAFLDATSTQLYVIASNDPAHFYWRRLDLTNPLAITGNEWSVSSRAFLANAGTSDTLGDQNMLYYDIASNYTYLVWHALDGGSVQHMMIARIDMANGLVTYGQQLLSTTGTLFSATPIRGVALAAGSLHILHKSTSTFALSCYTLASITFSGSWTGAPSGTTGGLNATTTIAPLANVTEGFVPVGLSVASDGKPVILYDDAGKAEKYNATSYAFEGVTGWVSSDIGSVFTRGGFLWTLNDVGTGESLQLERWYDGSTGTVSNEKSLCHLPDRQVLIGENTDVAISFEARDGYGAPMPQLSTQTCRFEIVTSRGALDADDSALSATNDSSTFRDIDDVPLTRQISTAFDSNGIATVYFQAARASSEAFVLDQVRVDYP